MAAPTKAVSVALEFAARLVATAGSPEHIAALAFAFAREIDRNPAALLRWRGCVPSETAAARIPSGDPWQAAELPAPRALRPLPAGAVLKRLGPSGVRAGGADLAEVLERAYAVFSER